MAQIFALIPGTSRAGASIVGAMLVRLDRKCSAEFSFSITALAVAAGFDLVKHYKDIAGENLTVLLTGFVISFITAYLTMKLFIKFL